ncbi:sulfotransferase [Pseudomonas sp. BN415]|nr:sulfotransferase [Pseudomonas sp. BN415]
MRDVIVKSSNPTAVTLVFVVHGGELEVKAAILAASLRKVFGFSITILAALPVSSSSWGNLSDASRRLYRRLSIPLIPIENPFGTRYPIGNKFSALALGPESGHTLFLDSDMICLRAFDLELFCNVDAALKPADMALVPSELGYWRFLYINAGLELPDNRVVTTCTEEVIPAYFNAGFILVRNARSFSRRWLEIAEQIDGDATISHKMPWLDQLALPVALKAERYRTRILGERFNYPLHIKTLPADGVLPYLCHYHDFGSLVREPEVRASLTMLLSTFPELREVVSANGDCHLSQLQPHFPRPHAGAREPIPATHADLVLTGIPRSGTSYLCRLLSELPDTVVLNEPPQVLDLLKATPSPWALPRYYAELRRDILSGKPVPNKHVDGQLIDDTARGVDQSSDYFPSVSGPSFRLATKNTLGYLSRLRLIRKVMPKAMFIVSIRHPYDTLSSWSSTFQHLRHADIASQPLGNPDDPCLTGWQRKALLAIIATESLPVRRALWWRYLALQVEDAADFAQVLRYEDLVEAPGSELEACIRSRITVSSKPRAWCKGLALDEQDLVASIVHDLAERFNYSL